MKQGLLGKTYADGEVIVNQGDVGDCMYMVQAGEVEVLTKRGTKLIPLRILGEGEIVGEMSLFDHEARSATVRAKGETRLLTIDKRTFFSRVQEDPSLAFHIVKMMAKRIRKLSDELAILRSDS